MKRKLTYLEYKYPGGPWQTYDRTQAPNWADIQEQRMKTDHPGAEYRREQR